MKKILLTTSIILLFSCGENKSDHDPHAENAVDNTDSSVKGSLSGGRDDNMIDKIYHEVIKNDKKLSALDDTILKTYENSTKVLENYEDVLNKSEAYYRDANYQANAITDSLLKHHVENQIKISSDQYDVKIKNVKDLISQLNKNTQRINDFYNAFKIRKTLPEIEKYQNAHPLKTDSLSKFITKQNQLLNELKNLK